MWSSNSTSRMDPQRVSLKPKSSSRTRSLLLASTPNTIRFPSCIITCCLRGPKTEKVTSPCLTSADVGSEIPENRTLSELDIALIRRVYPPRTQRQKALALPHDLESYKSFIKSNRLRISTSIDVSGA